MLYLAIDTTGPLGTCALWDGSCMRQLVNESEYSHLEEMVPMVKKLLEENAVSPEDLTAIAVSRGPGSFTGIRIGMATVKGLAQIWDKPVIEVPTLAAFAFGDYPWLEDPENAVLCPVFDARRSQVYAGAYRPGDRCPLIPDAAYAVTELAEKLNALPESCRVVFFGDGIKVYEEELKTLVPGCTFAPEDSRYQLASSCAKLGARLMEAGEGVKDCYTCQPEYLRLAEAERKLKEKQGCSA